MVFSTRLQLKGLLLILYLLILANMGKEIGQRRVFILIFGLRDPKSYPHRSLGRLLCFSVFRETSRLKL